MWFLMVRVFGLVVCLSIGRLRCGIVLCRLAVDPCTGCWIVWRLVDGSRLK